MSHIWCSLVNLLLLALSVSAENSQRITNGYAAAEGQFPYVVGLEIDNKDASSWWCGGSIIGHTWILTAAHCMERASGVTVYYGTTQRVQSATVVYIDERDIIIHSDFETTNILVNDLALIRTPWISFTQLIQNISLPMPKDRNQTYAGQWAKAVGWGQLSDANTLLPDQLQWQEMPIIEQWQCELYYGQVADGVICVDTSSHRSPCWGDSGGPLVINGGTKLIGVSSFVPTMGCEIGKPAGYARLTEYLEWIAKNTGIY
ncbi:serine protease 1-like [Drosophila tropicalis]|uniref:serine protease 1-like n=1 Tax=Drosophila tropicalis TaxID=46794 RepID=UPI0035ABE0EF